MTTTDRSGPVADDEGPPWHTPEPVDQEAPSTTRTPTFASFAIPAFRIIWAGTFLYYLAIFSGMIARGALAKELGGTNTALGVVTLAFGAVGLVMTPLGGVLADRVPKRRVLILSTLLLAVSSFALGITELLDVTEFWMLVVVSALQAVAFSTLVPARMAYTVELVGPRLIPNAVALAQISMNSNRVIGPALAGAFIGVSWLGFAGIYLLGGVLSVMAAAFFLLLDPGNPDPNRPQRAPLAELADGVRYARAMPSIRVVVVLAILVTMVGFPYVAFLPSVAEDFFDRGPEGFALLSLVGALGGLLAGVLVARTVLAQGPRIQLLAGIVLAAGLAFMGLAQTFPMALVAAAVVGASTAAFQSMNATLALSLSDSAYHGRIQSLLQLGFSLFGLASLPLGILADAIGLRPTLVAMGATTLVLVVVAELIWRGDRTDPQLMTDAPARSPSGPARAGGER
ncbi:MAG: MFS transporter [Actinomycetota bacterium]